MPAPVDPPSAAEPPGPPRISGQMVMGALPEALDLIGVQRDMGSYQDNLREVASHVLRGVQSVDEIPELLVQLSGYARASGFNNSLSGIADFIRTSRYAKMS